MAWVRERFFTVLFVVVCTRVMLWLWAAMALGNRIDKRRRAGGVPPKHD
jgi:hypothetical protein